MESETRRTADLMDGEGVGLAGPREVVVPRGDPPLQRAGHRGEREPRPPPQQLQLQRLVPPPPAASSSPAPFRCRLAFRRFLLSSRPPPLRHPRAGLRLLGQLMSLALATAAATAQQGEEERREGYDEEDDEC